jgi:hypothetical protein
VGVLEQEAGISFGSQVVANAFWTTALNSTLSTSKGKVEGWSSVVPKAPQLKVAQALSLFNAESSQIHEIFTHSKKSKPGLSNELGQNHCFHKNE